jgi:hypothetical protein
MMILRRNWTVTSRPAKTGPTSNARLLRTTQTSQKAKVLRGIGASQSTSTGTFSIEKLLLSIHQVDKTQK